MTKIPTQEEFGTLVDDFEKQLETVCIRGSYNIIGQDPDTARAALLVAYDAQAARIQAADAEVVEFNAGFDAYGAGVPVENEPSDTAHDVWRVGWAWAAFPHLTARVAELEAQLDAVATVLLERGCEGVVHECAVLEAQVRELEASR